MAFESDFLELMRQTISIEASSGLDSYGRASGYGAATQVNCRVQSGFQTVRSLASGEETVADVKVWCEGDVTADEDSRYTLPDGEQPPLIAVEKFADEDGVVHHTVLYFQRKMFRR